MKKRLPVSKIARFFLAVYAVTLTTAVALAVTIGPFAEPFRTWTKARVLETQLEETERERKSLEEERNRLLTAVKNLQAEWARARVTTGTSGVPTESPDIERRLAEANQLAEKLIQERAVLIAKLNELRERIEAKTGEKKTGPPK
ncbi:MAG: hypothetical protein HY541_07245 [Deltaproteobacteria bacterium]|nr:hypothetical protein [Deltaproteobacteria bacterium]